MLAKIIITLILLGVVVGLGLFANNAGAPKDLPQETEEELPKLAIKVLMEEIPKIKRVELVFVSELLV
jgi:hypothetical protein